MSIRGVFALVVATLVIALPARLALAAGAPPPSAPREKDDEERRKEEERKRKAQDEQGREPGAAPAEGGRVIGERSVRILDKEEWEAHKKKGTAEPESRAPEARLISSQVKQPTASSLGRKVEVSEGDGYRITRREILPLTGGGELYKTAKGYIVHAAGTVTVYDEGGKLLAKRSFLTPQRENSPLAARREISTCGVNAQGWLGLKDSPAEVAWTMDKNGKVTGRSNTETKFLLVSPTGGLVYSTVLEGGAVEIAPDGKTLLEWRGTTGLAVHDVATRRQKRLNVRITEGETPEKRRFVTDAGSILCMLSARSEGVYTVLHLSRTGEVLYQKAGPWWLKDGAANGNALLSPRGEPYRLIVLDSRGNQVFEKPCFQYGWGLFLNGGEYVVLTSLPGQREYYSTIFRVSDGKELCSIPTSHFYHPCATLGNERLYCYDAGERTLTVYSTETSRKLQVARLRHREPHALKVASMQWSEGALLLTFGGKTEKGSPLVYYKIELTDAGE